MSKLRKPDDSDYALGTLVQYFTVCPAHFSRKFNEEKDYPLHKDSLPEWYLQTLGSLKSHINQYRLENELADPEQGATLSRETFKAVADFLIREGSSQDRAAFTSCFVAAGRCGELAFISMDTLMTSEEGYGFTWGESKTDQSNWLEFFAACDGHLMCPVHSMACYLADGKGIALNQESGSSFLFPEYYNLSRRGGCANRISNILSKASVDNAALRVKNVSSHSTRRTAVNYLIACGAQINFFQLIARTGHNTENTAVVYMCKQQHQGVAGKLLSMVHEPHKKAPCPNLDVVTTTSDVADKADMVMTYFGH